MVKARAREARPSVWRLAHRPGRHETVPKTWRMHWGNRDRRVTKLWVAKGPVTFWNLTSQHFLTIVPAGLVRVVAIFVAVLCLHRRRPTAGRLFWKDAAALAVRPRWGLCGPMPRTSDGLIGTYDFGSRLRGMDPSWAMGGMGPWGRLGAVGGGTLQPRGAKVRQRPSPPGSTACVGAPLRFPHSTPTCPPTHEHGPDVQGSFERKTLWTREFPHFLTVARWWSHGTRERSAARCQGSTRPCVTPEESSKLWGGELIGRYQSAGTLS